MNVISGLLSLTALFTADARSASANGDAVDIKTILGDPLVLLDCEKGTGTSPTLDLTIQHREDSSDTWANIPAAALYDPATNEAATFTQVTDAANSTQTLALKREQLKAEIRAVLTLAGTTPSFVSGVYLAGQAKYTSGW